jgi:uncharacterized protein YbbC (DUF1343 family)
VDGVRFVITHREHFDSARLGIELACALQKLYPGKIDFGKCKKLIGSDAVMAQIVNGDDPRQIVQKMQDSVNEFLRIREKYLLYR